MKPVKLTIARRIITRLAKYHKRHMTRRAVYAAADALLSWPRSEREQWLLEKYDEIVPVARVSDYHLALILQ